MTAMVKSRLGSDSTNDLVEGGLKAGTSDVSITVDTKLPTLGVVIRIPNLIGSQRIHRVEFNFNKPIKEFKIHHTTIGDPRNPLITGNFSLSDPRGSGNTWTAKIILPENISGNGYIQVNKTVIEGEDGTFGPEENVRKEFDYDTTTSPALPAVSCSQQYDFDDEFVFQLPIDPSSRTGEQRALIINGGSFEGILECAIHSESGQQPKVYMVVQIGKYAYPYNTDTEYYRYLRAYQEKLISTDVQAEALLIKCDLNGCNWKVLKRYNYVSAAARSLKSFSNKIYFFEGSHYAYYNEGELEQIKEESEETYIRIGILDNIREADGTLIASRTTESNYWGFRTEGSSELLIVISDERADFQKIANALKSGSILIIGPDLEVASILRINSVTTNESESNRTIAFNIGFSKVNERTIPERSDNIKIGVVNIENIETVFSSYRLRHLYPLEGLTPNWKAEVGHLYSIDPMNNDAIEDLGLNWISSEIEENPNKDKLRPHYERIQKITEQATGGVYRTGGNPQNDVVAVQEEAPVDRFYGVHGGTASPIVSDGENLHLITGYSKLNEIDDNESESARIDNWQWIKYGKNLDRRIVSVETNGKTVLQIIEDVAKITSSIIFFDGDKFVLRPRSNTKANLESTLLDTETNFTLKDLSRDSWPLPSNDIASDRFILIEDELIKYTGFNDETKRITGATRGQKGTTAVTHQVLPSNNPNYKDVEVNLVDHVLDLNEDTLQQPISTINIRGEINQVKNNIEISYGDNKIYPKKDDESIAIYRNRELKISIPLDETQLPWIKYLADEFISQFKDLRYIITMRLAPTIYMNLGDAVFLKCSERDKLNGLTQLIDMQHVFKREQSGGLSMQTVAKFMTL